jgi:predicted 2-oxoglutarate/Fe(II)-dependent dioxygenase YbiX
MLFPEAEFISYDVEEFDSECAISPHTDNESVLTMIAMLSDQNDYSGGDNYFLSNPEEGRAHICQLSRRDLVIFRGEKLTHWISPVTRGNRQIFQMELSRIQRGNSGSKIVLDKGSLEFVAFQAPQYNPQK